MLFNFDDMKGVAKRNESTQKWRNRAPANILRSCKNIQYNLQIKDLAFLSASATLCHSVDPIQPPSAKNVLVNTCNEWKREKAKGGI